MLFKNADQLVENGGTSEIKKKRRDILLILEAAVKAVDPYETIKCCVSKSHIKVESKIFQISDFNNIFLIGFGKASIRMAQAVCDTIKVTEGVVITNDPSGKITDKNIEVIIGGHPIPTEESIRGAEKALQIMEKASSQDLVLVLISGGGSALMCKPRVDLASYQTTTELLLHSGADIVEMNTVRKHLSLIHGGLLVKKCKAQVVSLIISDIINDPIAFIASGPTHPDPTSYHDVKKILMKYNLLDQVPESVKTTIINGVIGRIEETLKDDNPVFRKVTNSLVATNKKACIAAAKTGENSGYSPTIITTSLSGEARTVGNKLLQRLDTNKKKRLYIAGGEPTVTVCGKGRGGRNQELVLGCLDKISDTPLVLASFATDGIDGKSDVAGAIADGYSLHRAQHYKLDPKIILDTNNSFVFFSKLNDSFITGYTGTNVMDIVIILT